MIAQNLGLTSDLPDKKELIEAILRQLTLKGMEKFSKKVTNKEVKTALLETAESHKPKEVLTESTGPTRTRSKSKAEIEQINSTSEPQLAQPKKRKSSGKHKTTAKHEKSPEKLRLHVATETVENNTFSDDEEEPKSKREASQKSGAKSPKEKKNKPNNSPTSSSFRKPTKEKNE